ncbi:hypothetical protein P167DRAFT_609657 [Morchella conica CCBAS932]|uniref:Galactose oxidase n=1 Tax=Morchella conica CCBAS932 TaxID=1392247 RepID=A0A3N4KCR8_9PEZI|nr:hypothetical protein P167DRAFT_609657 [Morchella conica CCBAS932]
MLMTMMKTAPLLGSLIFSMLSSTSLASGLINRRQDATGDLCRIWDHRTVMIDDWIYVDFGVSTWTGDKDNEIMHLINPFGINLTQKFDTKTIGHENDAYTEIAINLDVPSTTKSVIWADKDQNIYKWGGFYPLKAFWGNYSQFDPRGSEVWKLDKKIANWTQQPAPTGGDEVSGTRNAAAAYLPELGLGFAAGGHVSNGTDKKFASWTDGHALMLDSMVTYNMGNNSWTNHTTGMTPFTLSALVHVPIGEKGILISMGGIDNPGGYYQAGVTEIEARDFDSVSLYDVERGAWSTQRTTGDTPPNRLSFCAVVAVAADKSSYNLIVHGGASNDDNRAFSDTYVLTLPSFQWIKIDDGAKNMERADHTCHLSKNKMIVIGGRGADQSNPQIDPLPKNGECEPTSFINIFDVNTLKWETNWDLEAREDFKVPTPVAEVIGGDENGCATVQEPEAGWKSARIRELFSNYTAASDCKVIRPTRTSTGSGASATSTQEGSSSMISPKDSLVYLGLLSLVAYLPFI